MTGYREPPEHSKYKPGQSGNPKGRPKNKKKHPYDIIAQDLFAKTKVTENGKQVTMTKIEIISKSHVNKAMRGDTTATKMVMKMLNDPAFIKTLNITTEDEHQKRVGIADNLMKLVNMMAGQAAAYRDLSTYIGSDPWKWINDNFYELKKQGLITPSEYTKPSEPCYPHVELTEDGVPVGEIAKKWLLNNSKE